MLDTMKIQDCSEEGHKKLPKNADTHIFKKGNTSKCEISKIILPEGKGNLQKRANDNYAGNGTNIMDDNLARMVLMFEELQSS